MEDNTWYCKNGYAKVGDTLEFSTYNSASGEAGEKATIVGFLPIPNDSHVTLLFDDGTRCSSDKLWDARIYNEEK